MAELLDFLRVAMLPGAMIAIYFAFLKFGHKIGESHTFSHNRTHASGVSEVILTNLKDRSTPVFALYAVHGSVVITLIRFDNPVVLKSFDSIKIAIPPVSEYLVDGKPFDFTAMADRGFINTRIYFSTIGKLKECLPLSPPSRLPASLMQGRQVATVVQNKFNGRVYSSNVIYIIEYKINEKWSDAFVDATGFIDWKLAPNGIPGDMLNDLQAIADSLLAQMQFIEQLAIRKTPGWNQRFGIQEIFTHRTDDAPVLGKRRRGIHTKADPQ